MTEEEFIVLKDLVKKGWLKRTKNGGWEITDRAKAMIEKYGQEKALELFAVDEELEIEFSPEYGYINRTLH